MAELSDSNKHWQTFSPAEEANLYMLEHEIACDVSFLVGSVSENVPDGLSPALPTLVHRARYPSDEESGCVRKGWHKTFLAHRYVLITRSPVFEGLFCSGLSESRKGFDEPIKIPDIDPETFKELLRYIYGNRADITMGNVFTLLYASSKYLLAGLKQKCVDYLLANLTQRSVCQTLEHSLFFDISSLKAKCLNFLALDICRIAEVEEFCLLSSEALMEIVKQGSMAASEVELFCICLFWAIKQLETVSDDAQDDIDANEGENEDDKMSASMMNRFVCDLLHDLKKISRNGKERKKVDVSKTAENRKVFCSRKRKHGVIRDEPSPEEDPAASLGSDENSENTSDSADLTCAATSSRTCKKSCKRRSHKCTDRILHSETPNMATFRKCSDSSKPRKTTEFMTLDKLDATRLRPVLGDIIYCIRFSTLNPRTFAKVFGRLDILTAEEKASIYYDNLVFHRHCKHCVSLYTHCEADMKFECALRSYPQTQKLHRFNNMSIDLSDNHYHGGRYVGNSKLSFSASSSILLTGFGFYTGIMTDCQPFQVVVCVKLDDRTLSEAESLVEANSSNAGVADVNLPRNIFLIEDLWYTIEFSIARSSGSRFFGQNGSAEYDQDTSGAGSLTFRMKHEEGTTSLTEGQLARIYYKSLLLNGAT